MHVVFSRLELAGLVSNNENSYEVSSDYSFWVYSSLPRREVTVFDKKGLLESLQKIKGQG